MAVTRLSDFREFPACDVLGYSLDFTTASPTDIKAVGIQNFLAMNIHAGHQDPGRYQERPQNYSVRT